MSGVRRLDQPAMNMGRLESAQVSYMKEYLK